MNLESWSLVFLLLALYCSLYSEAVEISKEPKLVDSVDILNHPEGTNAIFTCSIGSGDLHGLSYEWFKDDKRLISTATARIRTSISPENDQSVLRISELNANDSAVYTCVAKNSYGKDKISTKLNVKVQLKWLQEPPAELQVPVGRLVQVSCRSSGQPEPKLEWRKLAADGQARGEVLGSELQFASVSQQDAGVYECRASNGVEKDLVARTRLNVLGSTSNGSCSSRWNPCCPYQTCIAT